MHFRGLKTSQILTQESEGVNQHLHHVPADNIQFKLAEAKILFYPRPQLTHFRGLKPPQIFT